KSDSFGFESQCLRKNQFACFDASIVLICKGESPLRRFCAASREISSSRFFPALTCDSPAPRQKQISTPLAETIIATCKPYDLFDIESGKTQLQISFGDLPLGT